MACKSSGTYILKIMESMFRIHFGSTKHSRRVHNHPALVRDLNRQLGSAEIDTISAYFVSPYLNAKNRSRRKARLFKLSTYVGRCWSA